MRSLLIKDLKLYGRRLLSMLLLICLITAGCAAAFGAALSAAKEKRSNVNIALYDKDPAAISNTVIGIISQADAVKSLFNIKSCNSEAEAYEGIKNGELDAAIVFEKNYFSGILDGNSSAVKILLSDKLTPSADIVLSFAKTGEKFIHVAEYGVMSAWAPLRDALDYSAANRHLQNMELKYTMRLLSLPEAAFTTETAAYSSTGVGIAEHYLLCFTVFLLILCEIVFFPYIAKDCSFHMLRRIKSYRIGNLAFIAEKAFFPFILRTILLFAAAFLFGDLNIPTLISALFAVAMMSLCMSSLSILLSQSALGISIIFAFASAGLFLCGGIIPSAMLPTSVIKLGEITPFGFFVSALSPLIGGSLSVIPLFAIIAISACLIAIAHTYINAICKKGGAAK